jgi:hypothetical protein
MAPMSRTTSYTTELAPGEVRRRTLAWFATVSHTVVTDTADRLEVKSGSQAKMRLIGGAFIAASSLPTRTVVTMAPQGGGTAVTVTADDAVGLGLKTGMKGKYEQWIATIVDELHAATA